MSEYEDLEAELHLEDIDFSDLENKYSVDSNFGLDNYVVVDGAPVAPESKADKLTLVLRKLFKTVGNVVEGDEGIYMPVENGKTKGFLFVQFETHEEAEAAVKQLHGRMLDQKHRLLVNRLSDIEKYGMDAQITEEFQAPEIPPLKDHGYMKSWLQDEQGRDQMALHFSETVGVYWNKKKNDPEPVFEPRKGFTSKYAKFSPKGTYLFSVHPQGVQAWGGKDFHSISRFIHNQVRLVDFSPNEKYMVTLSPLPITLPEDPAQAEGFPFGPESVGHKLVIWNLETGEAARTFALPPHLEGQKDMPWPLVKWSFDDKYCARQGPGALAIYETPSFQLLDKKLVKIDDVVDFEWAPAGVKLFNSRKPEGEYVLSYWTPESTNQTARVAVMQIPSREVIRTINLFQVSDCKIHWHDNADFLCVKVDRHTKSRKTFFSNLEFFKLTERDIPVEKLELKDVVINFAWEPNSERFVTVSRLDNGENNPAIPRNSITFYAPDSSPKNKASSTKYRAFGTVNDKHTNTVIWSPQGRYVVAATVSKTSGELEFYDTSFEDDRAKNKKGSINNIKLMKTEKYGGMTNMLWDPSGRFLAAWSSSWVHSVENGYKLYEFTGQQLRDETIDHFREFIWRPRPASLLSDSDRKIVKKKLREYSAQFDEADAMEADAATREAILARRKLLEEWRAYRSNYKQESKEDSDVDEAQVIEEIKEEIIEEKEEVVQ